MINAWLLHLSCLLSVVKPAGRQQAFFQKIKNGIDNCDLMGRLLWGVIPTNHDLREEKRLLIEPFAKVLG